MDDTSKRLKTAMQEKGFRAIDLVNKCQPIAKKYNVKMGRNDISQYLSGKAKPRQWKLTVLAETLDVSEAWLMGFDIPKNYCTEKVTATKFIEEVNSLLDNSDIKESDKVLIKAILNKIDKE